MAHFDERSGVVECPTDFGSWHQTMEEVVVSVTALPEGESTQKDAPFPISLSLSLSLSLCVSHFHLHLLHRIQRLGAEDTCASTACCHSRTQLPFVVLPWKV